MKIKKSKDVTEWIPIKDFNDEITLKDNLQVKILEVTPINFKLKSEVEQTSILEGYRRFLKQCNFDMQIIIMSQKSDVNYHLKKVQTYSSGNTNLKAMSQNYIKLVTDISNSQKSISRKFFIVIKNTKNINENISKIISGLSAIGNIVTICNENKIKEIFSKYYFKEEVPMKKWI